MSEDAASPVVSGHAAPSRAEIVRRLAVEIAAYRWKHADDYDARDLASHLLDTALANGHAVNACDCPVMSGEGAWREAHDPECATQRTGQDTDSPVLP